MSLNIQGLDRLVANLNALPERVSKSILRDVLKESAEPMRATASAKAPHGDPAAPNLNASIAVMTSRAGGEREAAVVVGPTKEVFYAGFVEFGTRKMPARPYLRPAFDEHAQAAIGSIGNRLWHALVAQGFSTRASGGGGGLL